MTTLDEIALGWVRLESVRVEHGAAVHARLVAGLVYKCSLRWLEPGQGHAGLFRAPLDTVAQVVGRMAREPWDAGVLLAAQAEADMRALYKAKGWPRAS